MNKVNAHVKSILVLLVFSSLLTGCVDDPEINSFERAEVLTADVPDTLVTGETYSIPLTFKLPTTCHSFDKFNIEEDPGEVFVSAVIKFEDNFNCENNNNSTGQADLEYTVTKETDFRFRFFQKSQNNQITYLDKEVVVKTE